MPMTRQAWAETDKGSSNPCTMRFKKLRGNFLPVRFATDMSQQPGTSEPPTLTGRASRPGGRRHSRARSARQTSRSSTSTAGLSRPATRCTGSTSVGRTCPRGISPRRSAAPSSAPVSSVLRAVTDTVAVGPLPNHCSVPEPRRPVAGRAHCAHPGQRTGLAAQQRWAAPAVVYQL